MKAMKNNDKLFDMLAELKISDEYIEDALTGDSDSRGTKVYAGKSRGSPIKIVAPIAACLAVFAAVGLIFANIGRLPANNGSLSPAGSGESLSDEEKIDQIYEDFKNRYENSVGFVPDICRSDPHVAFPTDDEKLVESCKSFIVNRHPDVLSGDVTWQIKDMDFDNSNPYDDEFLLCPQINGKSVKGVGAYVFKDSSYGRVDCWGSFGSGFDSIDLDSIYIIRDDATKTSYLFNSYEEHEKCVDSIQKIYIDKDNNTGIREESYLRLVKTYPGDASSKTPYTETAFRNGEIISTEELMDEWERIANCNGYSGVLPLPSTASDAHLAAADCVRQLIDKYNVPASVDSLHRFVQYFDVNNDGVNETVLEIRNCEQLRGIYIFSADGKLICEFNIEDEIIEPELTEIDRILSHKRCTPLRERTENGENHYYYYSQYTRFRSAEGYGTRWVAVDTVYEIVVNEDGTLGTKKALEYGGDINRIAEILNQDDKKGLYKVNGEDVSFEEYCEAEHKYVLDDIPFVW